MKYYYDSYTVYNCQSRAIAHGIKNGDMQSIHTAAERMAALVPDNAVLVPMPSHHGYATQTLKLCMVISAITGCAVVNALEGLPRLTNFEAKKAGRSIKWYDMGFHLVTSLPEGREICVIDNVIDTGNTAMAAVAAIGDCKIIAYAMTKKTFR